MKRVLLILTLLLLQRMLALVVLLETLLAIDRLPMLLAMDLLIGDDGRAETATAVNKETLVAESCMCKMCG